VLQGVVEYYVKNSEQLCLFEVKPFHLNLIVIINYLIYVNFNSRTINYKI